MTETIEPSVLDGIPPGRYQPPSGTWDEMWDGLVRPHWHNFASAIAELGADELERRRQQAERFLRENGVTFNLHTDELQDERPWQFDPLPLLLDEPSWSRIEAGVAQRARVFEGVLADLLGPRSLVDRGAIPADLVYGPGGLSLPCVGSPGAGAQSLTLYSADIARGPDGKFQVLADHTQAPFGMGYALENRTATTRLFPDIFSDGNVRRLASFFRALHAQLSNRHRNGEAAPRIVVLTPGPRHPTYFEHAYLAAYLGYALVQASDLTVRNGAVWLKSLQGLERVDVILRRLSDAQCDPLELRGDSTVGVPGLLEAARQGQVAVVNPLGAGVLENPGLLAYLPTLAQRVLGEELLLPSAPTWWCGDGEALDHVLAHLPDMVIKSTVSPSESRSVIVSHLDDEATAGLRDRITVAPHEFSGQQMIDLSTAPSFVDGQLRPRPVVLRVFAVASDDGFLVMPGALTRSPADAATATPSAAAGVAKDTWILADRPQAHVSLWQRRPDADDDVDPTPALPSRAAENLFWVGRYAERAEATSRLLRTIIEGLTQHRDTDDTVRAYRDHLLAALTILTDTTPGFVGEGAADRLRDPRAEIISVAADAARPGSLAFTLQSLVRAAFAVRDRWSTDSWRVVDDLHEYVWRLGHPGHDSLRWVHEQLDQLITPLSAFAGLNQESMTREPAWILLDMGRRIERALLLTSMLRACLVPRHEEDVDQLLMEAVLMSKESLITYRRRYRSYPQLRRVLELLVLDRQNPRGLAYQLQYLRRHLHQLPGEPSARGVGPVERPLLDADTQLRLADADELVDESPRADRRERLESLLGVVDERLREAAAILDQRYFRHISDSRQLVQIEPAIAQ